MAQPEVRWGDVVVTLGGVGVVAVLVALGAQRGLWVSNLHNAVLATTFTLVGALTLAKRPGHAVARQFVAVGVASAVLYLGRQVGLASTDRADAWWGWLGVWPTAVIIGLTTWVVLGFPEGRPLSPTWRRVAVGAVGLALTSAALSALYPVEYGDAAVGTPYPFRLPGPDVAQRVWDVLGPGTYLLLQGLWVVGLAARWRVSDSAVRRQLTVLLATVAVATVLLLAGLVVGGTPTPGLIALGAVPVVAGRLLDRMSLAHVVEIEQAAGRLPELSPRENDVLELMAQGLSNAAIADRLCLSVKTVEPAISSIFRKLGLAEEPASNRRVLAVVQYWSRPDLRRVD
ncbi:helix-turn-helix transcriptional regulator [Nocardioides sp. QY071]|uniref:helix-turn-helix transcriptional regulator n=1 Tax=Nocardioides sp. QY071 TaxID=3044187 RepID=UPI00249C92E3|nr:helix-turn-helix transcriptional regulator [Nocardioides sp. QY071]WGX99848.1 helix-turn-helix transcriptional regulator [Nocardioides sp. QY071]